MKPTLEQVRDVIDTMVEHGERSWIGEGEEIAKELLDYIDGKSPDTPAEWKRGMDEWVYLVADVYPESGLRGPFNSRQEAETWLAKIPEQGASVSTWGRVSPRASYRVLTREAFKAKYRDRET